MTKFLNISTDNTLGGVSPSDETVASQKAIKEYVDGAIPTVNNPTITITQGGVTKGSFTLNQASGDTIALDAGGGGGGGLPDQTGHAGEFLTTDGTDASWSDAIGYHPDLFDVKWSDHLLNDMSWLCADTFSWQSGDVYVAAYNHLVSDIDGKTLQSETVDGLPISYYLADDGHKICLPDEEIYISFLYENTGVAWYYILDTENKQFKLPRTKFGFTGLRDGVGNYVEAGVPNITGVFDTGDRRTNIDATGAFFRATASSNLWGAQSSASGNTQGVGFDASRSNSIYGNSYTVQPPATEMYLYFYVGNFTQTALENTAGLNAELFNQKADLNLANSAPTSQFAQLLLNAGIDTVIERQEPTADNNYTWYRKYKSGWVEQGGLTPSGSGAGTITLPVVMADNNYQFYGNPKNPTSNNASWTLQPRTLTTTTAGYYKSYSGGAAGEIFFWRVSGMAA